ncbi:MAG TPA: metallophosphoesterase [Dissulfurispiraceae bacterium]|nr:metallophosphoesterase [Dissulfurispiraceae bacterium]
MMSRRAFLRRFMLPGAACLVGGYSFAIERTDVEVNRYRIALPRLPAEFDGFTIVHLTDLHYGPFAGQSFFEKLVERVNGLSKDIVVCTGDYVLNRNTTTEVDAVWPILAQLQAPSGVYSVLGNHDHWADSKRSIFWLEKSGQSLRHKVLPLERDGKRIWLAGSGDLWEDHHALDPLLRTIPKEECRIILAHNPDSADRLKVETFDLMLAGHTHGGQVRFPLLGAPFMPVRNKDYTMGLVWSLKGAPVFISRGVGSTIPFRFNCAPEIALIELART